MQSLPHVPAKRDAPEEQRAADEDDERSPKSRRRAFSCISCQRLKCRCDYDYALQSCTRCHSLRTKCSRKDPPPRIPETSKETDAKFALLEDKLQRHDEALAEIADLLRSIKAHQQPPISLETRLDDVAHVYGQQAAQPTASSASIPRVTMREEDESAREAEAGVTLPTAPLMVIRDIGTRFPAPLKKTRRPTTVRIIDEGLLDEKTARELAAAFPQSGYNSVLLPEIAELDWKDEYRDGLPFLHSVCCVHVIADRRDMAQTMLHRRIFERVKLALGTLLLDYPLSLDEIQGILMCTDSFRVGAGDGKEFIDSWMLTGYCAKQAMLCIEFDRIARETRQGKSGAANVRAIRLWATICLHHLHWTAASGRPSTITESYLNYCPLLLNFYDASVQDGILLAELFLYSILPTVLEKPPQLDVDGDCNEFAAWRHEWRHLLALPAAALLKMGYASACLLLVVRGLEHQGEQLGPAAFLSRHSSPTTDDEKQQQQLVQQQQIVNLRRAAAKHAHALLQTFLGMPDTLQDSVSSNRCLCLTYGALVLAHYDESQSSLSDMDNLRLVRRLHEWFSNSPSKVVLARFTNLCEHIIVGRLERARTRGPAKVGGTGVPDGRYQGKDGTGLAMAHGVGYNYGPLPDGRQVVASHASSGAALTVDGVPVIATFATSAEGVFNADPDAQEIAGLFDMLPSINLEDFFAGGYLEM